MRLIEQNTTCPEEFAVVNQRWGEEAARAIYQSAKKQKFSRRGRESYRWSRYSIYPPKFFSKARILPSSSRHGEDCRYSRKYGITAMGNFRVSDLTLD